MFRKTIAPDILIPLLIGIALLIYIVVRAITIPITIDEANTCLTFSTTSVWSILTYVDPIPNNHIVNTLLVKLFSSLFGMKQFVVRLPNILGFILFYYVLVVWLRKINKNIFFILTGIVIFVCNPFLIDFFSLARGYALSIDFMIVSSWFAWRYITEKQSKFQLYALIWGAIAVYTNFTILNFYGALCILFLIIAIRNQWRSDKKQFYKLIRPLFVITLILATVSFYPIYRMISTDQFIYWGSTGFYSDTIYTLADSSEYGINYFHFSAHVWANIFIFVFALISFVGVYDLRKNKWNFAASDFIFFAFLLCGTVIINVLQFYLVKTPWLTTRTALFYYPLMMIAVIFSLKKLNNDWKAGYKIISVLFICLGIIHFSRSANIEYCYEWKFDRSNDKVIEKLDEIRPANTESVTLDVFWLHYPSMDFLIRRTKHQPIELIPFHKDVNANSRADYYYLYSWEFKNIQDNYEVVANFNDGETVLAKKKSVE